jgi:hypothetical protein
MKAKMKIEFKRAPIFIITCIALLGLLGFLGYRFIIGNDYLLTVLVAFMCAVIPLFLVSRFFYGIRINDSHVLIISQDSFKRFKTDSVSSLNITFNADAVKADVLLTDGSAYTFMWFDCVSDEFFDEVKLSFSEIHFVRVEKAASAAVLTTDEENEDEE